MTHIYKFGHVINNELQSIVVFFGSKLSLNELFKNEPENKIFEGLFSPEEIHNIVEKNIPVNEEIIVLSIESNLSVSGSFNFICCSMNIEYNHWRYFFKSLI